MNKKLWVLIVILALVILEFLFYKFNLYDCLFFEPNCSIVFGLLFVGLIYSIWAIVSCVESEKTKKSKTIWISIMVLIFPFGSWFYGLFASEKKYFKVLSAIFIILVTCFFVYIFGYWPGYNHQSFSPGPH